MNKRPKNSLVYSGSLAESPVGTVWVGVSERGLVAVQLGTNRDEFVYSVEGLGFNDIRFDTEMTGEALRQIGDYLEGKRQIFELPIDWSVLTSFQEQVLQETYAIPYGQMATYGELARRIGKPKAARAVGRAEATNPMPVVIPCHRVVGSDGGLHGYGAGKGLETKAWLLRLEGAAWG